MNRLTILILINLIIIICSINCSPYLGKGNDYLNKGMLESAIYQYEQGIQKSPNNYKVYLYLSHAQDLLSKRYKIKAEENLQSIVDLSLLEDRQKILDKSISLNNESVRNCKQGLALAPSRKETNSSPVKLEQLKSYRKDLTEFHSSFILKIQTTNQEINKLIELANQKQKTEDWDEAEKLYKKALSYHSSNELIKTLINIASSMAEGVRYFNVNKFEQAKQAFSTVLQNDPDHLEAKNWINKSNRNKVTNLLARASQEKETGNLIGAMKLYKECLLLDENYPGLKSTLDHTIRDFAQLHHEKAVNFEQKSLLHHAYMEFKNVIDHDGRKFFPSDYTKAEALKNKIFNEATFRIAIIDQLGFGGGQITRNVSQGIVSKLFESEIRKNGYIQILTREQLNQLLHEQALSLSGVIDPNTVINTGGIKGVSYFTMIEVSYFDGDEYNSIVDSGEKKYVAYQKQVLNPDYVPEKDRKKATNLLESIEALAQELTPKYIKEDVYGFCRYEKIKYEVNAKIDISISIFNAETGEILLSEFLPVEKKEADYEVRVLSGDANKAGITQDSKNIKTKQEMMQITKDEGIQRAAQIIINKFENIPNIYEKRGDYLLQNGQIDSAIENYVKAIVLHKTPERSIWLMEKVYNLLK